jgi:hypothetical protein
MENTTIIAAKLKIFFAVLTLDIRNHENPNKRNMIITVFEGPNFVIKRIIAMPPNAAPRRSIK